MTAPPRRMTDISGEEALYLLDSIAWGRLVYTQRQTTLVRPGSHVLERGRLIVRVPAPTTALYGRPTLTYHVDQIAPSDGSGWAVTASGVAEVLAHPDEAAHYRRVLPGWAHGPHDSLVRLHPKTIHGYRFGAVGPSAPAPDTEGHVSQ